MRGEGVLPARMSGATQDLSVSSLSSVSFFPGENKSLGLTLSVGWAQRSHLAPCMCVPTGEDAHSAACTHTRTPMLPAAPRPRVPSALYPQTLWVSSQTWCWPHTESLVPGDPYLVRQERLRLAVLKIFSAMETAPQLWPVGLPCRLFPLPGP